MNKSKPQQRSKVVPFTGELYQPEASPAEQQNNTPALLVILACAIAAGLSVGSMLTYQSTDQSELRRLKADQQQLQQVKEKACNY
ncbi:MAG: hypothetical protein RMX65_022775 [Nostoc sp. DedQUE01]|nr:hypothetical protein [Nostoc sp. DedQUE01]